MSIYKAPQVVLMDLTYKGLRSLKKGATITDSKEQYFNGVNTLANQFRMGFGLPHRLDQFTHLTLTNTRNLRHLHV